MESTSQEDKNKSENIVDLGFAEKAESWMLVNRYFPSKIGGRPAWLELKNLPKIDELKCPKCEEPCIFLCQVYAPIEEKSECFHRTIFVFICKNENCFEDNSSRNIIVLRSQLPRINDFYSPIAPNDDEQLPQILPVEKLCIVCGCRGPFVCSKCKSVTYCGQVHQRYDWKNGHKQYCESKNTSQTLNSGILFPEYELIMEAEIENSKKHTGNDEKTEKQRLEEYEKFVETKNKSEEFNKLSEHELSEYASGFSDDDKQFRKFKKTIDLNPEQVLRYNRGGKPLWITNKNSTNLDKEIPNCELCGKQRIFEFQIMPQMLNLFKDNDKFDWGVIAIYTCEESCTKNSEYIKEFVIKQDLFEENKET